MAITHNFLKELHRLGRTINKLTCGQARLEIPDDEERTFYFYITPDDGYYKGSTCKFKVDVPEEYPEEPPLVRCLNKIYHPNIDFESEPIEATVCVNLLDADWQPGVGLDGCVMAVLFLFHNPNTEDALNPVFRGSQMDEQEFEENVRKSLKGEEVEGFVFDKLINEEPDLVTNVQMNDKLINEKPDLVTNVHMNEKLINEELDLVTNVQMNEKLINEEPDLETNVQINEKRINEELDLVTNVQMNEKLINEEPDLVTNVQMNEKLINEEPDLVTNVQMNEKLINEELDLVTNVQTNEKLINEEPDLVTNVQINEKLINKELDLVTNVQINEKLINEELDLVTNVQMNEKLINEEPDLVTNVQMNEKLINEEPDLVTNVHMNEKLSLLQKFQFPKFAFFYSQIWHKMLIVLLRLCRHFEHLHES